MLWSEWDEGEDGRKKMAKDVPTYIPIGQLE
jgi:hypothetical protein